MKPYAASYNDTHAMARRKEDDDAAEGEVVPIVKCRSCGHAVPESNLQLHLARGCGGHAAAASPPPRPQRLPASMLEDLPVAVPVPPEQPRYYGRAAASSSRRPTTSRENPEVSHQTAYANASAPLMMMDDDDDDDDPTTATSYTHQRHHSEEHETSWRPSWSPPPEIPNNLRRRRPAPAATAGTTAVSSLNNDERSKSRQCDNDDEVIHVGDVINLADDDDEDDGELVAREWTCPRCTLLNPLSDTTCSACLYHNATLAASSRRPADPIRRERLIGGSQQQQPPSSGLAMSGGALLGSVLGAADAFVRGRSVGNGALNGAVSGAIGGAVVGEVLRDVAPRGGAAPSSGSAAAQQFPTRTIRVMPEGRGYATVTTTTTNNMGMGNHHHHQQDPQVLMDALMMQSRMLQPQHPRGWNAPQLHNNNDNNIDNMSYERLLEVFGDGSENRRANPAVVNALPVSVLRNVERELPVDCRQCSICLEPFRAGDARRTLPCLHGFHQACVDQWLLQANASCPVCKHGIDNNS